MKKYISEDDEVNDDTNGHTNRGQTNGHTNDEKEIDIRKVIQN